MTLILPAQVEDAPLLTEIAIAAKRYWNYPERWIQIWLPVLTISPVYIKTYSVWKAVEEETPVGFYSLKFDESELWLDNLWVTPAYIGKGIGRLLFYHLMNESRSFPVQKLKIEAEPNAVKFYEKMGARIIGEHRGEVDGQPRILPVMEIPL